MSSASSRRALLASLLLLFASPVRGVLLQPLALRATARVSALRHSATPLVCLASKKGGKGAKKKAQTSSGRGFGAQSAAKPAAKPISEEQRLADEQKLEWRTFERWLSTNGAILDAVELADCGGGLRGVRATRSLKAGEELFRMPRELILDEDAADESAVAALWGGSEREVALPAHVRLALLILHELRLGEQSAAAPYLRMLPSPEDFAADGGPASTWSDDELAACGCAKLQADAQQKRAGLADDLAAARVAPRWTELGLPGEPPSAEEVAWAVAAVTSRAYSATPAADAPAQSMMIPMADMANHVHPVHTVKGLSEDGAYFIVLAREPIKKGEQVFVSYGALPCLTLLLQFGFVPPSSLKVVDETDFGLVDCAPLLASVAAQAKAGAEEGPLEHLAAEGLLMRERGGAVSAWQPTGASLRAALLALATDSVQLPAASSAVGAQAAADAAYTALLRGTLETAGGTAADDRAALRAGGLAPRARLALEFRTAQRVLLNAELAAAAASKASF